MFRNFGGIKRKDCENFLYPRIYQATMLNSSANKSERMDCNSISKQFSTSSLINGNIKRPCACEICHAMIIRDTSLQSHLLTDSNITNMKNNKTFGSQLISIEDKESSSINTYHTSERMHHSIRNGIILVLLKFRFIIRHVKSKQLYHLYVNKIP